MDKKQNRDISGSGEQTTSEAMEITAADTTWTKSKQTSAVKENTNSSGENPKGAIVHQNTRYWQHDV
ncbi:hypothetical protein ACOMHN_012082 [Nucella lapillus]